MCDVIGVAVVLTLLLLLLSSSSFVHFTVSRERTVCTILMGTHARLRKEENHRRFFGRSNIYIFYSTPPVMVFLHSCLFYLYVAYVCAHVCGCLYNGSIEYQATSILYGVICENL